MVALRSKEEMEKFNSKALTEIAAIKDKVQSHIYLVKKVDQG